jgi:hypothetical protein
MRKRLNVFLVSLIFVFMLVFVSACEEVIPIESITVTGELSVEVGEQAAYTAVIMPVEAQNAKVTWSIVEDTGEATIYNKRCIDCSFTWYSNCKGDSSWS